MKRLATAILVATALTATVQPPARIRPRDAKKFVGKDVVMCGRIVTYMCSHADMVLLNVDKPYWSNDASIGIRWSQIPEFGERIEDLLLGAEVCATGRIERVEKQYVLVVDAPSSMTLTGSNAARSDIFAPEAVRSCRPEVEQPTLTREVKPNYTSTAMAGKVQGLLLLEAVVLPNGTVGNVRIVRSLDRESGLDDEGIMAVRQWRFRPGKLRGQVVPMIVSIQLSFRLR